MLIAAITAVILGLSAGGGGPEFDFLDQLESRIKDNVSDDDRKDQALEIVDDLRDRLSARFDSVLARSSMRVAAWRAPL